MTNLFFCYGAGSCAEDTAMTLGQCLSGRVTLAQVTLPHRAIARSLIPATIVPAGFVGHCPVGPHVYHRTWAHSQRVLGLVVRIAASKSQGTRFEPARGPLASNGLQGVW